MSLPKEQEKQNGRKNRSSSEDCDIKNSQQLLLLQVPNGRCALNHQIDHQHQKTEVSLPCLIIAFLYILSLFFLFFLVSNKDVNVVITGSRLRCCKRKIKSYYAAKLFVVGKKNVGPMFYKTVKPVRPASHLKCIK